MISENKENMAYFRSLLPEEETFVCVKNEKLADFLLQETGFDIIVAEGDLSEEFLRKTARLSFVVTLGGADLSEAGVFRLRQKEDFAAALGWFRAARAKIAFLQKENGKLQKKIDDLALIARAKRVLEKTLGMSEAQAHRYIEKQAMDLRVPKSEVAGRILSTYEN